MGNKHGNGARGVNLGGGLKPLDKIQIIERNKYDAKLTAQADFLLQIGCDAYLMSLADLFDLQPGRAIEAVNTYREYMNSLMAHLIDDASDPELVYFWTDLDRRMEQIVGKSNFKPREKRYDETGRRVFDGLYKAYQARKKVAEQLAEVMKGGGDGADK